MILYAMDKAHPLTVRGRGVRMAQDRSMRRIDADGRLHVEFTPISKANVCEYFGREIPDADKLGLAPDKLYRLYRHPAELKKGQDTFNNIPLLIKHVPVHASEPQKDLIVGSTGTDAKFTAPYLNNSLVVWTQEAIDLIDSKKQKELSSAYRYRADMTPGVTPEDEKYDGVMRDIIANHVALVEEGRAGPDVFVMDAKPNTRKEISMSALSRKALFTGGALSAYLRPKLAADAKLDLNPILKDVSAASFDTAKIEAGIRASGVLAQDADLKDMTDFINHLKDQNIPDEDKPAADADPAAAPPATPGTPAAPAPAAAAVPPVNTARDAFRDTLPDDNSKAAFDALFVDKDTSEEDDNDPTDGSKTRASVSPSAMDSAIKAATDKVRADMVAANEAREYVAPWVGKLSMALDSADAILKTALEAVGVATKDLHPSAYKAVLAVQAKPGASKTIVAQDAAVSDSAGFSGRFGNNADRIRIA